MEKPLVSRSSRCSRGVLNLAKPAPRKNNINVGTSAIHVRKEVADTCTGKENIKTVGKRASRGLKLEKPLPRVNRSKDESGSRDKQYSDCSIPSSPTRARRLSSTPVPSSPTTAETPIQHRHAEMKATMLVQEALADMDAQQSSPKSPHETQCRTRMLSQVSQDSGLEDMSSYSRQSSLFESLSEHQDELDWGDIDDSAEISFSFGNRHMSCTSYAVNLAQPFNDLASTDRQDVVEPESTRVHVARGRKHSYEDKNIVHSNHNIARSYSVPTDLPNHNTNAEFWDNDADLFQISLENQDVREQCKFNPRGNGLMSICRPESAENNTRKRHHTYAGDSVLWQDLNCIPSHTRYSKASSVIYNNRTNKHSIPNISITSQLPLSEELDSELVNEECFESECKYKESSARSVTPVNIDTELESGNNVTYSAIHNGQDINPEDTPQAGSLLTNFTKPRLPVQQNMDSTLQGIHVDRKNPEESVKDKENYDQHSLIMQKLSSSLDYRETCNDSSFTNSSTEPEDGLSQSTTDEGFNEQIYAWELIEDLSNRVHSLKLDQEIHDGATLKILDNNLPAEFTHLPDDTDAIEAELEFMAEHLPESFHSSQSTYKHSVLEGSKDQNVLLLVIRQPLNPQYTQDELWYAEEGSAGGLYTAKGRRRMFKNHQLCRIDDHAAECQMNILQYSPEELLQLGTSPLSKMVPDTWPYLVHLYPVICLKEVTMYFDTEAYSMKKNFLVGNPKYVTGEKTSKLPTGSQHNFNKQDLSKPPPVFGAMQRGGFGCPRIPNKMGSSGIQQPKKEDHSVKSQRYSAIPSSETKAEPYTQSAAGENQSRIIVDQSVEFVNDHVNLDTKCDVSVREEGRLRLFTAAASKILPTRPARNYGLKRSLSDPEGNRLSVSQEINDEEICEMKQTTPVYTRSMQCDRDESDCDLILNKGLPAVCPW